MANFTEIEKRCIEHLETDYMPLHDIVREFSGFEKKPCETDFLSVLEFLDYMLDKYKLEILEGPSMKKFGKTSKGFLLWLKKRWYSGEYEDINYRIWFRRIT